MTRQTDALMWRKIHSWYEANGFSAAANKMGMIKFKCNPHELWEDIRWWDPAIGRYPTVLETVPKKFKRRPKY